MGRGTAMSNPYKDEACADIIQVLEEHYKKRHYKPFRIKLIDCTRQENTGNFCIAVDHRGGWRTFPLIRAEYRQGWEMMVVERIDNWLAAVSDRTSDE